MVVEASCCGAGAGIGILYLQTLHLKSLARWLKLRQWTQTHIKIGFGMDKSSNVNLLERPS